MKWADLGIRVNAISPDYTLTPMNLRPEVAEQTKKFAADTPLHRMTTPDEVAGPAIFLSSKAASFVTGIDLIVDVVQSSVAQGKGCPHGSLLFLVIRVQMYW
jgi:NAD(P)-dependent dehydrogenase (short-subunit alcohol dehydrogenase family)